MADFAKIVKEHGGDISETAINAITSAIKTAVGNEYVEKERYKAKLTEIDNLKDKVQTADDKATTAEKWKEKYDDLKTEFDTFKNGIEAEKAKKAKEDAYREALKDANLNEKGIEKAVKYAEWDKIELDDKGKLKDAKDHVKNAREEWAEYVVKTGTQGATTTTPPANNGNGSGMTVEEIMKIEDTTARQKAIAENHELFGF